MPSGPWYSKLLRKSADQDGKSLQKYAKKTSIFHVLPYELAAFHSLMTFVHARGEGDKKELGFIFGSSRLF